MTKPKVSVVVPVYNTDKFLKRCIDSIINQTLTDIEIIIVDDGSKPECAKLCDELKKTDDRIKVIHKENGGLGFARNTGIKEATGEYIGFVDSDDYIDLKMYEALYNKAVSNDADLVISGICFVGGSIFSKEDECIKKSYFECDKIFYEKEGIKDLILGVSGSLPYEPDDNRYGASVCKNLFKKEILDKNNLEFLSEREFLSEDTLFMTDFLKHIKKAVGIPEAFYCYVRNGESLSKSYNPKRLEKTVIFLKALEERLIEVCERDEYKIYLSRLIQGFGRVLSSQEIIHAKENNIPYSSLKAKLKKILIDLNIKETLKTYPWHKLPVKQAVFAFAMKYKLFFIQRLLVLLRNG